MDINDTSLSPKLIKRFKEIKKMPVILPSTDRSNYDIKKVGQGGYLRFNGQVFKVMEKNRYEDESEDEWFELKLFCLNSGEQVYIEWEVDDNLEVSITTDKLALTSLGITRADLTYADEEEEGEFDYQGKTYYYEDSGDVTFYRKCGDKGDEFYVWEFLDETEDISLTIEEWDEGEFSVSKSQALDPDAIDILILGGD